MVPEQRFSASPVLFAAMAFYAPVQQDDRFVVNGEDEAARTRADIDASDEGSFLWRHSLREDVLNICEDLTGAHRGVLRQLRRPLNPDDAQLLSICEQEMWDKTKVKLKMGSRKVKEEGRGTAAVGVPAATAAHPHASVKR